MASSLVLTFIFVLFSKSVENFRIDLSLKANPITDEININETLKWFESNTNFLFSIVLSLLAINVFISSEDFEDFEATLEERVRLCKTKHSEFNYDSLKDDDQDV